MELFRKAALMVADPNDSDWTRENGLAKTSEFPFPDLFLNEKVTELAAKDADVIPFLHECLRRFVNHDYGNIISIAKKFGMRKEEIPVLVKVSKPWDGNSVEELSNKYAQYTPDYTLEQNIMESVLCMFDSYCIPQGREVMNYYLPLQYGWDGIIELCNQRITETMGEADSDGILGMGRGYYYVAMKILAQGMSKWCQNYADRAHYLASIETDPAFKKNYEDIEEKNNNNQKIIKLEQKSKCKDYDINEINDKSDKTYVVRMSIGMIVVMNKADIEIKDFLERADAVLYKEKKHRRKEISKQEVEKTDN